MPLVVNVPEFWIYRGSEYASGFEYAKIQGYTGLRVSLNNS